MWVCSVEAIEITLLPHENMLRAMEIELAVSQAAEKHEYSPLKDAQRTCIEGFLKGRDVFVVLPTGFGKTACYVCLPSTFDFYLNRLGSSTFIVVVVRHL